MTESQVHIGDRTISLNHSPFVIAELSGNHNQSLSRALKIVDAAAEAGVAAVKLQTYTADTMTLDLDVGEFRINDPDSLWHGRTLHALYEEAHTPWDWHEQIFAKCSENGIVCFSTPFDDTAVDFLEELGTPCYKIASFENTDLPLIERVASTGKPIIMSTGMATAAELDEAVRTARDAGCDELVLLKCTSSYPASPEGSNLRTLPHLRDLFDCEVGVSDHTLGLGVAVAAVALGATVIEKHFTLRRADGGVDSAFSLEPEEMQRLVDESSNAWESLGRICYGPTEQEVSSLAFRRSLYVAEGMQSGDCFNTRNLRCVRPGRGLPPKYYDQLLGKRVNRDVAMGTPVDWDMIG